MRRAFHVNAPGATVSLQRLTIYRGTATLGGAIFNEASALTRLASCSLLANRAQEGGAIFNAYGSTLAIDSCLVADNTAVATSGNNAFGGAIMNTYVVRVSDSKIVGNGAMASDAGRNAYGGGVYSGFSEGVRFSAVRTVFSGNNALSQNGSAEGGAGAMNGGLAIFTDCRVIGNATYAPSAEGRAHGGGLYFNSTVGTVSSTAVTGNRELPKVMSIVPWKPPEPPTGPERPMGSLIEELLAPVDRDEFRREITYYRGLTPQSTPTDPQVTGRPATAVLPDPGRPVPTGLTGA